MERLFSGKSLNAPKQCRESKRRFSSTVIDLTLSLRHPTEAVLYYYFDFNDKAKQTSENLLRSLVVQISHQSSDTLTELESFYSKSRSGQQQPTTDVLIATLKQISAGFRHVYILIDALDECGDLENLLYILKALACWRQVQLSILVTSRRERGIEFSLESTATRQVDLKTAAVDADIEKFVQARLNTDIKLQKWPLKIKEGIKFALVQQSNDMYEALHISDANLRARCHLCMLTNFFE